MLDSVLDEPFELHCIGGFAVVMGYGLARNTNDLDYRSLVPNNRMEDLEKLAGLGSVLARKHKVHLQYTSVESMPDNYERRLTAIFGDPETLSVIRWRGVERSELRKWCGRTKRGTRWSARGLVSSPFSLPAIEHHLFFSILLRRFLNRVSGVRISPGPPLLGRLPINDQSVRAEPSAHLLKTPEEARFHLFVLLLGTSDIHPREGLRPQLPHERWPPGRNSARCVGIETQTSRRAQEKASLRIEERLSKSLLPERGPELFRPCAANHPSLGTPCPWPAASACQGRRWEPRPKDSPSH